MIRTIGFACCCALLALSNDARPKSPGVVAIDVLLQPDAALADRAKALNARLRQKHPKGFPLDAGHVPHVTLVQRYVRASDVEAVGAAVAEALKVGPTLPLPLKATGITSSEWAGEGLVSIEVERTPDLARLEDEIVKAVQPFSVGGGSAEAFVQDPGRPIDEKTIRYVKEFVPASSGGNYKPHVTVGTASPEEAKALEKRPFEPLPFQGVGVAIYRLGNFGTARERLWPK